MERSLSTAEDRRAAVLEAGLGVFARSGYRGTPVSAVAAAAGISPAYVFRLFPAKVDLFTATLHTCFARILKALRDSVEELPAAGPEEVLAAMANAYAALIADRKLLMLQVHALAASDDTAIREALRGEQARLADYVADRSKAPQPQVQAFFARGQLCHMVVALDIESSREPWASYLTEGLVHTPPGP
ncbi:TetR/AcrR family transcriptional regulator [Streptomyces sp. NBC_01012]|uniref:TetR/AcrR family transcriptional regulator n=1 Tax=Streptomyces sp. NBC_01012 TaxID=2903717 RepID=UPI00386559C1|nr:TetR/AcrR family transcriptional regulator [Streptomyces sp. NBC_01012]